MMLRMGTALSAAHTELSLKSHGRGGPPGTLGPRFRQCNESPSEPAVRNRHSTWRFLLLALWLLAALAASAPKSEAQGFADNQRVVLGKVVDPDGKIQANAVVYLQNLKTGEIRSYITVADGSYRFGQLNSDVDYKLWARLQALKSKARTISSFDSKKLFSFELKLEPAK